MQKLKEYSRDLTTEFVESNGIRTAIFLSSDFNDTTKPVALLIHGFNSTHAIFLNIAQRAKSTRFIFVDLPGHGRSSIPDQKMNLAELRKWFSNLVKIIAEKYGVPKKIILYSIACHAFDGHKPSGCEIIFLCPVPTLYENYASVPKIMDKLFRSRLIVRIYRWTPFAAMRGFVLLHNKTRESWRASWITARHDSTTNYKQLRFQVSLCDVFNGGNHFDGIKPDLVLISKFDDLAQEKSIKAMRKVFPSAKIRELNGGHLMPIDCAEEVIEVVKL